MMIITTTCSKVKFMGRKCNQGRVAPKADPSHPMHGLYRFKTGFGGQMYHQMGCWDYPLDMDGYRQFAAREMSLPGYYA